MGEFRVHRCRFFDYQPKSIQCLAYSPEFGRIAISRSDASLEIWNVQHKWYQEKVFTPQKGCSIEALLWSSSRLFSAGLHCQLCEHDPCSGQIKSAAHSNSGPIWCLAMNIEQTQIAAGTEEGCVVLFDVFENNIVNSRLLDKAEGRILSIAWYKPLDLIVTGGIDCIRVWSSKSGHAMQRLTIPRKEKAKETIVWALAITQDFTIISGDSSGKTCFWNGKQGTLTKAFDSHRAAVLTLTLSEDETKVFSAGIDPSIVQFDFIAPHHQSNSKVWILASKRTDHSHDVRALQIVKNLLVSGGVDCALILFDLKKKFLQKTLSKKIPPIPHKSLVQLMPDLNAVMVQYPSSLDIWKLGTTNAQSDKDSEILPLWNKPVHLLQLKARKGESISCCAASSCGSYVAYCDTRAIYILKMSISGESPCPAVQMNRLRGLPSTIQQACCMTFASSSCLVTATLSGQIQVISLDEGNISVEHTVSVGKKDRDAASMGFHLLTVCPKSEYVAFADHDGNVYIMNLTTTDVFSLPKRPALTSALAFHPEDRVLLAVYTDLKIFEYDFEQAEYTEWSRQQNAYYHPWWLNSGVITQASYRNKDQMLLRTEAYLFVINKQERLPGPNDIFLRSFSTIKGKTDHAYHVSTRFKYLLHAEPMGDDYLVVVEQPPLSIVEALPPPLKLKQFGT